MRETTYNSENPLLSVIVLTYNEETNLPACLESLRGVDCETFVVDSGSTDRTVAIAGEYGARVVDHPFETHAKQWDWALNHVPIATDWVLGLDADQRLTPELRNEIAQLFGRAKGVRYEGKLAEIDGFYIKRRQVFRGKWIRHGGYYPKYLLKLFRRERVKTDTNDLLDHHFYIAGQTAKLRHDLIEENQKESDISFWIEKHNGYASLLAREELEYKRNGRPAPIAPSASGNPDQRALWMKRQWHRMPLYVRPFLYFVYRYFLCLGFLDGKEGFIFHFLQGFWFRLLVDIKIEEMRKAGKL